MPVTAKLSKLFYDRLGEQIANELVDWFNQVDATYRADLRELNELNFARFDAKLEQRIAQLDAKLERRLAELDAKWTVRWEQLDAKIEQRIAELRATMERRFAEQTRWLFVAWASLLIPIIGLWIRG
ncbi:MAG: hypothetical protein R3268_10035 [Acidiferrobacterales bacterium]|nr:hypothetical protein [Acidiferrobacterales bacterium]